MAPIRGGHLPMSKLAVTRQQGVNKLSRLAYALARLIWSQLALSD